MRNMKMKEVKRNAARLMLAMMLMPAAGLASAAAPILLDESQMDAVSAGQASVATASASALFGVTYSKAHTFAFTDQTVQITQAGALGAAVGFGALATASATSYF